MLVIRRTCGAFGNAEFITTQFCDSHAFSFFFLRALQFIRNIRTVGNFAPATVEVKHDWNTIAGALNTFSPHDTPRSARISQNRKHLCNRFVLGDFLGFAGRACEACYRLAGGPRERKFLDSPRSSGEIHSAVLKKAFEQIASKIRLVNAATVPIHVIYPLIPGITRIVSQIGIKSGSSSGISNVKFAKRCLI